MDSKTAQALRKAFAEGTLEVEAVAQDGSTVRAAVFDVLRHEVPHKKSFRIMVMGGHQVVATEDHSLFRWTEEGPQEVATGTLAVGDLLACVRDGELYGLPIYVIEEVETPQYMYDLSVPGPENFVLANGIVAHNSYSIGGISLDIEKSSKYESLKQNAEGQMDKAAEAKKETVKFIRGLQQPRYGIGVRSAFGPHVSRGVLSPQNFV